jgi:glycosyltransferase involved in cell wall biosynthesis
MKSGGLNICFIENSNILHEKDYVSIERKKSPHTQSSVVRVLNVARSLFNRGHSVSILNYQHPMATFEEILKKSDVVIFHRIQASKKSYISWKYLKAFLLARSMKKIIVFDLDDAIHLHFPLIAEYLASKSNAVFAGSHQLMFHYQRYNKNVFLVPSAVDTDVFKPQLKKEKRKDVMVIGWHGSASGHLSNLRLLAKALKKFPRSSNVKLKILGTGSNQELRSIISKMFQQFEIDFGPPFWVPYRELPKYLRDVDIGVYPLVDNYWNRSKCSMKLLEYMALGLPTVSSGVGENLYIIKNGLNGFLAFKLDDWIEYIIKLLDDTNLYESISKNAYRTVAEKYSLEKVATKIENILYGLMGIA